MSVISVQMVRASPAGVTSQLVWIATLAVVTSGCASRTDTATHAGSTRPRATLPRIHEPFTTLPCPRSSARATTLGAIGCAEHEILRTDAKIVSAEQAIFSRLAPRGRSAFAEGERSWLAYRRAYCNARASSYAGGSIEPVIFATCAAGLNQGHLRTLSAFRRELRHR